VFPSTTLAVGGLTITVATGAGVTVSVALPLLPSLVPVMFAVPTVTAVTSPSLETVATAILSELQAMLRSVSTPPLASLSVAVACAVSTAVIVLGASATDTEATGTGITVTVALPIFPSLVAVIVAVPGATAVTKPDEDTVATAEASELQTMVRPVSTLLPASSVVAVACVV
jgi:hypothetical protein